MCVTNATPSYTLFSGFMANPDHRENYQVHKDGARTPAVPITGLGANNNYVNYKDAVTGFVINGSLPVSDSQGVHSLTDVPVFAMGPCQQSFAGVYNSIDIFFGIANCFGLARGSNSTSLSGSTTNSSSSSSIVRSSTSSGSSVSSAATVKTVTVTVTETESSACYATGHHTGHPSGYPTGYPAHPSW